MFKRIINTLGPGLLFSATAIGVSHLVMSSRAGANYGLVMLAFVILANIFKYPFFKFGPIYAAATGNDLLIGYRTISKKALILFLVFTLITFFIFIAAVTNVTAGLAIVLLNLNISIWAASTAVLIISGIILYFGHYHYLVKIVKLLIIVLTISTIIAFIQAGYNYWFNHNLLFNIKLINNNHSFIDDVSAVFSFTTLPFIIALMGWMPAPIEVSVWQSIWQLEKKINDPHAGSVEGALIDFKIGYFGTAIIAVLFVCLGFFILHNKNIILPDSSVGFAKVLITLYTQTLGVWSWPIIALASFATMFSTTLTLLDGYARVIYKSINLVFDQSKLKYNNYNIWLIICMLCAAILLASISNMKAITMMATILSFITAPVFAYLNYKVISDNHIEKKYILTKSDIYLSYIGISVLTAVSMAFCVYLLLY